MSSVVAITVDSAYGLCLLVGDMVYVMLFPQLLAAVYFPSLCNAYGSLAAFVVGLTLRSIGGEPILGIPALFRYPLFDEETQLQLFPIKTVAMLASLATLVIVSAVSRVALLSPSYDLLRRQFTGEAQVKAVPVEETVDTEGDDQERPANCTSRTLNSPTEAYSSV
ncbi:high-affinity choline transporter 1-like [Ixodes scapularis]|uniref:high-affinity choline transporter 1-like n=1 Tax=Ixodes scapularis TaxID=6945 RepID=UPI001A9E10B1|nr:high-affinity choline transporter 1-like [Ixodes scapularis]